MQIAFVHVALNISNLDPRLHIYVLVWVALHISSIVTELTLYFALFTAPVKHLTPPTPPMWWSRVRVSAPTFPRAYLCPRVPLTSLGSRLMTRTATWSLEAGHTTALRSEIIWSGKFYTFYFLYFHNWLILGFFLLQLDFQLAADAGDTASFIPNGEWALMGELAHMINEMRYYGILTFYSLPYNTGLVINSDSNMKTLNNLNCLMCT